MKIVGEIVGAKEFKSRLADLPTKLERTILHKAVNAAAQPILQAARANLVSMEKTGALRSMLTKKVKRYPMRVVAVIGPKNEFFGKVKPARYSHLLEFGVKPHHGNPGFRGRKWLTMAAETNASRAQQIMSDRITEEINKIG